MRIIKPTTVRDYYQQYPNAENALKSWLLIASKANWQSIVEVRKTYPHADAVSVKSGNIVTVFNIMKNRYRLVVAIHYNAQRIYIRDFLTHSEYSKDR